MLDHDPLLPIPGAERPTDSDDPDAFVAKLRYQQTKVGGITPTILVEHAVVNVITERQRWLTVTYPHLQPKQGTATLPRSRCRSTPTLSSTTCALPARHSSASSGPLAAAWTLLARWLNSARYDETKKPAPTEVGAGFLRSG